MMDVEAAKTFAEEHFPEGPEKLAEKLGITVRDSPLTGCDGWVLVHGKRIVIRINSESSATRRRFTLAHELGHLLLGVPTVVGETVFDSLRSDSVEERRVNTLAGELLLPESVVRRACPAVPVVATQFKKLAKRANISELAVAIRVVNLAASIGLQNASVAFFKNGEVEWQWSNTLMRMPTELAISLLEAAQNSGTNTVRIEHKTTRDVIVASQIANPAFNSATLFVQLLPLEVGNRLSSVERRKELETFLFEGDPAFGPVVQGCMSQMKRRCTNLALDAATADFDDRYREKWTPSQAKKLKSPKGREYVRLRLQEWCG